MSSPHTPGCDPSNVSLVSTKLEQVGLVRCRSNPSDGRARVLVLTERGQALLARLVAEVTTATPQRHLDAAQRHRLSELLDTIEAAAG